MSDIMSDNLLPITFQNLRAKGFRLWDPYGNYEPHMRIEISVEHATFLEVGRCGMRESDWSAWIVGEMSGRYGKFCYLRTSWTMGQLAALYESLTDKQLQAVDFDLGEFEKALEYARKRQNEHWNNHYTNDVVRRHMLLR